jgi:predicted translation initiation factor SUI1
VIEDTMAERNRKNILFLCTGNYYRSRFAEIYFNSVAEKMGLAWRASSKGLALERGVYNVGPMAVSAIQALEALGVQAPDDVRRFPAQVTVADFERAERIVALKKAEHLPLLQERFPEWIEKVEFWHVDDAPEALSLIEREIMSLVARILGGGNAQETPAPEPEPSISEPPKKSITVKLGRETKGRRGKGVTTVSELPLDEAGLLELAGKLKQKCGTGGTVKDSRIEIQGDQRDRLAAVLESMGYRVKRVGG